MKSHYTRSYIRLDKSTTQIRIGCYGIDYLILVDSNIFDTKIKQHLNNICIVHNRDPGYPYVLIDRKRVSLSKIINDKTKFFPKDRDVLNLKLSNWGKRFDNPVTVRQVGGKIYDLWRRNRVASSIDEVYNHWLETGSHLATGRHFGVSGTTIKRRIDEYKEQNK